jgi:hypothetical protein
MSDNIIIIQDLLDTKARKEKELYFYNEELKKLQEKMKWLKMEIKLTEDIINMIEREKLVDIKDLIKKGEK